MLIQQDPSVELLALLVQCFVSFREVLVLVVEESDLLLQLPNLLIGAAFRIRTSKDFI